MKYQSLWDVKYVKTEHLSTLFFHALQSLFCLDDTFFHALQSLLCLDDTIFQALQFFFVWMILSFMHYSLYFVWMTLSFMHCRPSPVWMMTKVYFSDIKIHHHFHAVQTLACLHGIRQLVSRTADSSWMISNAWCRESEIFL